MKIVKTVFLGEKNLSMEQNHFKRHIIDIKTQCFLFLYFFFLASTTTAGTPPKPPTTTAPPTTTLTTETSTVPSGRKNEVKHKEIIYKLLF